MAQTLLFRNARLIDGLADKMCANCAPSIRCIVRVWPMIHRLFWRGHPSQKLCKKDSVNLHAAKEVLCNCYTP
jgi:hypothetical protein